MGEGILMYGLRSSRRRYTRDLQAFADNILSRPAGRSRGQKYIFGDAHVKIRKAIEAAGIKLKSTKVAITEITINKYRAGNHEKESKGAVISRKRFRMVEAAVKHPKNVYYDVDHKKNGRIVIVTDVKYSKGKMLKIIIQPNKKIGKRYYNEVFSIGVVAKHHMNQKGQYEPYKRKKS